MRIQHNGAWINVDEEVANPWDVQQRQKSGNAGKTSSPLIYPILLPVKGFRALALARKGSGRQGAAKARAH